MLLSKTFLERTEKYTGDLTEAGKLHEIIPGDWGKAKARWLTWLLLSTSRKASTEEAGFTGFCGSVRALLATRIGTER